MKHLALAILLCACGGTPSQDKPTHPSAQPNTEKVDAGTSNGSPNDAPGIADTYKLSSEECQLLFEHIFDIAVTAQFESLPEEERPTEADISKVKFKMRSQLLADCQTQSKTELDYDCYMEASSRDDIARCDCYLKASSPDDIASCDKA